MVDGIKEHRNRAHAGDNVQYLAWLTLVVRPPPHGAEYEYIGLHIFTITLPVLLNLRSFRNIFINLSAGAMEPPIIIVVDAFSNVNH